MTNARESLPLERRRTGKGIALNTPPVWSFLGLSSIPGPQFRGWNGSPRLPFVNAGRAQSRPA